MDLRLSERAIFCGLLEDRSVRYATLGFCYRGVFFCILLLRWGLTVGGPWCDRPRPVRVVLHLKGRLASWMDGRSSNKNHLCIHVKCPSTEEVRKHLARNLILVDRDDRKVYGIELAEDPLHVYKRLVDGLTMLSRECAFAIRCLRKFLGSCNPAVRVGEDEDPSSKKADEAVYVDAVSAWRAPRPEQSTLAAVLTCYFSGHPLGPGAWEVLVSSAGQAWSHPWHAAVLPPCARAVILDDAARASGLFGGSRRTAASAAYPRAYAPFPTADSFRDDLQQLETLLQQVSFAKAAHGGGGAWHVAQVRFLSRTRKRPNLAKDCLALLLFSLLFQSLSLCGISPPACSYWLKH